MPSVNYILKTGAYCLIFISIYFYIFAPPFRVLPFGLDKLLFVISIVYITYKKSWGKLFNKFKIEYILLFCLFLYSFFRGLIGGDKIYMMYDFLLLVEVITTPFAFYLLVSNNKNSYGYRLDKVTIMCSIMASFISVFLLLNPEIALYFKTSLLKYPEELIENFYFRGYGFSDGLLFGYPVTLGFCGGLLILGVSQKKYSILFILPFTIAIFANARSGLIPLVLSILIASVFNLKFFLKRIVFLLILAIVFSSIVIAFFNQNELLKTSFEWGMTSFDIVGDFLFKGQRTENVDVLFSDMLILPNGIEWLWGSGRFLFGAPSNATDIGYLLRLNFGGVFYSLILLLLLIYMFIRLAKANGQVAFLLFISLVYLHFKADFFIVNPSSRFLFFLYTGCILNNNYFKPSYSLKIKI